jgi:MFS family permease
MPETRLSELLAQRQFLRFWFARLAGTTANQMLMVAVAWQMYDITSSAWDLGLVGLFQFVPALLMALPAGHLVDRHHRGRIFAACMATQSAIALLLVTATQSGFATRELILLVSIVLGVVRAFQMPAQQALTPQLVPQQLLPRAIALSSSGVQAAIICGPALGGALYTAGATTVYACGGLLSLLSCALTLTVRYRQQPSSSAPASWRTVFAGVAFVWQRQVLLGAMSLDLFAVLLGGAVALLPIYARDILHSGPFGLGLLRSAPAFGALAMSLALTRWPLQRHVGHRLLAAVALFGAATLVFGVSTNFGLSLAALAITGAADTISVVTRQTLTQLETPDAMRGRVASVNTIFIGASNQLGEFESGATAALLGPQGSVILGGIGTMLVALGWLRLFPALAQRDRMI